MLVRCQGRLLGGLLSGVGASLIILLLSLDVPAHVVAETHDVNLGGLLGEAGQFLGERVVTLVVEVLGDDASEAQVSVELSLLRILLTGELKIAPEGMRP